MRSLMRFVSFLFLFCKFAQISNFLLFHFFSFQIFKKIENFTLQHFPIELTKNWTSTVFEISLYIRFYTSPIKLSKLAGCVCSNVKQRGLMLSEKRKISRMFVFFSFFFFFDFGRSTFIQWSSCLNFFAAKLKKLGGYLKAFCVKSERFN